MTRAFLLFLGLCALASCAALQGCSTLNPTGSQAIDRMIADCMRQTGGSRDECQQQRGCQPGMSRRECRSALRKSLDIWVRD